MKKLTAIFLCAVLLLTSGCGGMTPATKHTRYQAEFLSLFDTVTTIVGYADSKEDFTELAGQIRDKLEEYHRLYSIYDDFAGVNNIKTINDNAGMAPVPVDSRIIDLLQYAKEQYAGTKGTLNIALGSVLKIWHDYREAGSDDPENAELPPMELLRQANEHTNIDDLVIDAAASTVYLKDPLMRLDVGAIAKGYATEQVAQHFENQGVTNLLLSVGGNVRALGGKFDEGADTVIPWAVGVRNPDLSSTESTLMSVLAEDCSIVSSGIYERYYTVDGVEYHHIIDPETLMPTTYYAQVTIVCKDSGLADALSTAAFVLPRDEALAYINAMDGVEACWVLEDGSQFYSDGFEALKK